MRVILNTQFPGTTQELAARVAAFQAAVAAHAQTVGQPAPREDELVEELARTGEAFEVVALGQAQAETLTPEEAYLLQRRLIDQERDRQLASGVVWNAKTYHVDETFQGHLTGLMVAYQTGILPAGMSRQIRTMNNEIVLLTQAEIVGLAAAVLSRVEQIFQESWAAKDALTPPAPPAP